MHRNVRFTKNQKRTGEETDMRRIRKIKGKKVLEAKKVNQRRYGAVAAALILCLTVVFGFGPKSVITALAADTGSIDLSREGSITVTLLTAEDEPVTDGSLTIYKAADLELPDWNMTYVYTDDFAGLGEVPYDMDSAEYANLLAQWAADDRVSGTTSEAGSNGTVIFRGLTAGVYLIVQTEATESLYSMNPFVVTLPMDEDGTWVYDIAAIPKTEIIVERSEIPEEPGDQADEGSEPEVPASADEPVTETTGSSVFPQTGQLYRPVPVLVLCIAALVAAVWLLRRERDHA